MATQQFGLLDEREEAELHKVRLLNVEEKPFKRLTKRLIAPGALTNPTSTKLPTPPPEGINNNGGATATADSQDNTTNSSQTAVSPADAAALKEDIALDFAAFDSAIARLQLLGSANAAERERYDADRERILGAMEGVRASNGALRSSLETARETLARRRGFDDLADRITANRLLRPRAEQHANLRKLADECAELERESEAYAHTWRERRGQFDRLVDESKRLLALIRDEKEEVERREGMDEGEENAAAEDSSGGKNTPGPSSASAAKSGNATPRPDGGTPLHHHHQNHNSTNASNSNHVSGAASRALSEGGATPRPVSRGGERTPARPGSPAVGGGGDEGLKPRPEAAGSSSFSRSGSQDPSAGGGSQQPTPTPGDEEDDDEGPDEGEDVEMVEPGTQSEQAPQITVDSAAGAGAGVGESEDQMDTT